MPRFYFDVKNSTAATVDDEGVDFEAFEEAKEAAIRELVSIIKDEVPDGERLSYVVTVRDEEKTPVYVATGMIMGETLSRE